MDGRLSKSRFYHRWSTCEIASTRLIQPMSEWFRTSRRRKCYGYTSTTTYPNEAATVSVSAMLAGTVSGSVREVCYNLPPKLIVPMRSPRQSRRPLMLLGSPLIGQTVATRARTSALHGTICILVGCAGIGVNRRLFVTFISIHLISYSSSLRLVSTSLSSISLSANILCNVNAEDSGGQERRYIPESTVRTWVGSCLR